MNILILTQPLRNNYGGILQAYALQRVLKKMGHSVYTENIFYRKRSLLDVFKRNNTVRKICGLPIIGSNSEQEVRKHLYSFIDKNIQTISVKTKDKKELNKYCFDVYIVGSDQVWRPKYSTNIYNYFLDFVENDNSKKISYAASFGVDEWEFTKKQTLKCKELIKSFDAVSVREESGMKLCEKYLNAKAKLVLDPTMLLSKEDYLNLIGDNSSVDTNYVMSYILDNNIEKKEIIDYVSIKLNLKINDFFKKQYNCRADKNNKINNSVLPRVEDFIKGFMNAKFVVTDSFHGMVFSIIFNKQFIVIGNKERGIARFKSLLNLFGLNDRLITNKEFMIQDLISKEIDYAKIGLVLEREKKRSIDFITQNI